MRKTKRTGFSTPLHYQQVLSWILLSFDMIIIYLLVFPILMLGLQVVPI